MAGRMITIWSKWLRTIHSLRVESDMTYTEAADELRKIADHYDWYGKTKFNEQVNDSLKEDSNAM